MVLGNLFWFNYDSPSTSFSLSISNIVHCASKKIFFIASYSRFFNVIQFSSIERPLTPTLYFFHIFYFWGLFLFIFFFFFFPLVFSNLKVVSIHASILGQRFICYSWWLSCRSTTTMVSPVHHVRLLHVLRFWLHYCTLLLWWWL